MALSCACACALMKTITNLKTYKWVRKYTANTVDQNFMYKLDGLQKNTGKLSTDDETWAAKNECKR